MAGYTTRSGSATCRSTSLAAPAQSNSACRWLGTSRPLDNLEWADGYRPRFGLVYVDFATQRRVLKDSGAAYADIIRTQRARSSDGPVAYPAS
jgi:hypothetical protein